MVISPRNKIDRDSVVVDRYYHVGGVDYNGCSRDMAQEREADKAGDEGG